MRVIALTVVTAAAFGLARAEVPLSYAKTGHATVPVTIGGGQPVELVLDTGAEGTALYAAFADSLRLKPIAGRTDPLVGQTGETTTPIVMLPRLSVDGHAVPPLEAVVLTDRADGVALAGILGADVLARFLVEIDFPAQRFALHPATAEPGAIMGPGATSLDVTLDEAKFAHLPVGVGVATAEAVLDTGARKTRINWKLAGLLGLRRDSPGLVDAEAIQGATNNPVATKQGVIGTVVIGPFAVRDARALIVDLPVFDYFRIADRPAMILGLDLLQDAHVLVDYGRHRLWIERRMAQSPVS